MTMTRLLYLGFAFPPGIQALFPSVNPAGHGFETQMVAALRPHCDLRSASVLGVEIPQPPADADPASGVAHELVLRDSPPEVFHRWRSLARLKQHYRRWTRAGWRPDAVLVYNLGPIYNQFIRWLRRQAPRPRLVLLLLDSAQLGKPLPALKRFRYRFKPFVVAEDEMLREFDAAIGLSRETERFFAPRGTPFLWMPGGCTPARGNFTDPSTPDSHANTPLRLGYFGALAAHAGVMELIEAFGRTKLTATLHVCGYGKRADAIAEAAKRDERIRFHGLLPTPADCLRFGRSCDVLVNPRPAGHGNENNFPSKIFEYALCGRAILTTRLSGVDAVLGVEAFYCDPSKLAAELPARLAEVAALPRAELHRRGAVLRERVTTLYSWPQQAAAMAAFIEGLPPG
jgi:glycosyltransferase involved in cell wall biosynthesis